MKGKGNIRSWGGTQGCTPILQILNTIEVAMSENDSLKGVVVEGQCYDVSVYPRMTFFKIKDGDATLSCISFGEDPVRRELEAELKVQVSGDIGLYRGSVQLKARQITVIQKAACPIETGLAALAEERREVIPLPSHIYRLGIVTSPAAAGLRDFLTGLGSGFQITLYSTTVQGSSAPEGIRRGIERANRDRVDLICLIRGGGSREDLSVFDHLTVGRAICRSGVPVLTGIGHQIDVTLADRLADWSTITPTAASTFLRGRGTVLVSLATKLKDRLERRCQTLHLSRERLYQHRMTPAALLQSTSQLLFARLEKRRGVLANLRRDLLVRTSYGVERLWRGRSDRMQSGLSSCRRRLQEAKEKKSHYPRVYCGEKEITCAADLPPIFTLQFPDGIVTCTSTHRFK